MPAFTWLTGFPAENLVLDLNGFGVANGELYSKLEASVREHALPTKRRTLTSVHLRTRHEPERPPPRVIVLTGPAGAGKRHIVKGLVAQFPALFAAVVSHTSRPPREHEAHGVDYIFTDKPTLRCAPFALCYVHEGA